MAVLMLSELVVIQTKIIEMRYGVLHWGVLEIKKSGVVELHLIPC